MMVTLSAQATGLPDNGALIGFGNSTSNISFSSFPTLDLTLFPAPNDVFDVAFQMPADGMLTLLSASFVNSSALAIKSGSITLHVALYRNATPVFVFNPIPGADVTFVFTGILGTGVISSATVSIPNIPVFAGDRLMLLAYITTSNLFTDIKVAGYISAGLRII
jgi:BclB C-terminal domain-containing protein